MRAESEENGGPVSCPGLLALEVGLFDKGGDPSGELVDEDDGAYAEGDCFAFGGCRLGFGGLGGSAVVRALSLLFGDGADATGCGEILEKGNARLVIIGCNGSGLILGDAFYQIKDAGGSIRKDVQTAK